MTVIIILAIIALLLGLVEIALIPGFGIAGIAAFGCAFFDIYLVYQEYGVTYACVALLIGVIILCLMLWWVSKSDTMKRMALTSTISSTAATEAQLSVCVGDKGVAETRLALVGNARFEGKLVQVKSAGPFINPGTPIIVIEVSDAAIIVRPTD